VWWLREREILNWADFFCIFKKLSAISRESECGESRQFSEHYRLGNFIFTKKVLTKNRRVDMKTIFKSAWLREGKMMRSDSFLWLVKIQKSKEK
jgi:hypothetical protein